METARVKAPFTFLQIQLKRHFANPVKLAHVAFGLVTEIFDAIKVVLLDQKSFAVLNPNMAKVGHI